MIFLRPFFLLLLLLPLLLVKMKRKGSSASIWEKLISPELLPFLLVRSKTKKTKHFQVYKIILWCVLVVGLSGPAWYKKTLPAKSDEPSTVIVLELGATMVGDNLEKAKRKINDILDELSGEQVALVLYDKIGYTAAPLTFDTNIIRDMIPHLERSALPNPTHFQPVAGLQKAADILESAGLSKGRIIYISGGMELDASVQAWVKQNKNPLGILVIGSLKAHPVALPTGGFLKDDFGNLVMIKPNWDQLSQLGVMQVMTADRSDIRSIIQKTPFEASLGRTSDAIEVWQDMGGWFVAFSLPFFAMLFRKRLMILFLLFALPVQANLWFRPDQEAYLRQEQGVKAYRAGNYENAEELFSSGFNAEDLYNWGNALAFQQKIEEAIDAYQQVLDEDPNHQDAQFNKEYLEKQLKKQQENQNSPQPESEDQPEQDTPPPPEEQPQDQEPQPPMDEVPPPEQQEQSEQEQSPESPNNELEMQQEQMQEDEQLQLEDAEPAQEEETPFDQQSQQILNKLPETPPSLLKYRLHRQYEKNNRG